MMVESKACCEIGQIGLLNSYAQINQLDEIKLNLGSGGRPLKGWINIDNYDYEEGDTSRSGSEYDIKMDIRQLDVDDETVDAILMVHVVEHFVRWEFVEMLDAYHAKLKKGGQFIIETPDLDKCIEWYLRGRDAPHINTPLGPMNMGKTQFYGNQWSKLDYETHRYVWTLKEMVDLLQGKGFEIAKADHNALFHKKGRDMFVIGVKS
jgi:predicted SAM-dependent methyltransferase